MRQVELVIIGAGPAGLCTAISALEAGVEVLLIERDKFLGGQLVKQTHMFFGSEKQYASVRGIDIADILIEKLDKYKDKLEIMIDTTVLSVYEDGVISLMHGDKYEKILPKSIVVATGASEKVMSFPNNDLPGIYGAGAVQTLMNVYGVKPGDKVLMVGAGNIGLIVSYQMLQAGVDVVAILDAAPTIGGYLVHASKVRRMGIPILTKHSIKEALGTDHLEKLVIWELDENWQGVEGSEKLVDVDVACVSVGLTPLTELLCQAGCEMKYVRELSGLVPVINKKHETTVSGIFVAGDVSGVEEASSAMVEGFITGLNAAEKLGKVHPKHDELSKDYHEQLHFLRSGEVGNRIRQGIAKIIREDF